MTSGDQPPAEERHGDEIASIRDQLRSIEDTAGAGYRVVREPNPPYGWNLVDPTGVVVCSGPLDRLELWVTRRNTESGQ
ncbi:hypothetical protein CRH09_35855 [Nocardia terpenica]|uniref:Uncharacterized protein n=1 Tax=Nocardia terpenica TaxID=455432 RepID=A0A291RU45_9NOCA|nr:hypothetical protein CRH09_35855 [Nocardia terpenica]